MARIHIGEIVAGRTTANRPLNLDDRLGQFSCIGGIHLQHKESETLSGLGTNTRKFLELIDQPIDRFRDIGHQNRPGIFNPPVIFPSWPAIASSTLRMPSLTAATIRS